MQPRIDYLKFAPEAQRAMYGLEKYLAACGLEHKLLHLLKLRASQINGCAYCIDMHSKDARALGEPEQRLYELDAWRETPFYTDRERAALAWVESVTLVSETHVPDAVYEEVKQHFSEKEVVDLTILAATINMWNPAWPSRCAPFPGSISLRNPRPLHLERRRWLGGCAIPCFALTGEGKAAILASDDWPASRTARRKKTEPSARGRGRRRVPRAGPAFDVRRARRAAHRSHSLDPYPCTRRCAGTVWFCVGAGKTFL